MSPSDLFSIAAVLLGAIAQAITGIGFALVCAPLLTLTLAGGDGVRLANLLSILVNLLLLRREWRSADLKHSAALFLPAMIAAPLVAMAMGRASAKLLSAEAGFVVLATVTMLAAGVRIRRLNGPFGLVAAGALSGGMNVVGGVSGPIVASYAANAGWPPEKMRPTLNAYFLGTNVVSVIARGVPPVSPVLAVVLALTIFGGFAVGTILSGRMNKALVEKITLALAALGALGAILQGLI